MLSQVTLKGFRDPHAYLTITVSMALLQRTCMPSPWTKQSPHCKCVRGHHAISKLKDFYPLQSVIKAWKGFLLRDSVFDGFSLFTINLGLKYCGLSLLDWNNGTTISGTITSVLFEVPGPNLESVHTRWKIKRETITTWWLPWRGFWNFTGRRGGLLHQALGWQSLL